MTRLIARSVFVVMACVASASATAQLLEGRDYIAVEPAQPTNDPTRIVVTEFFSYQCPHCFSFFPSLNDWVGTLPDDTVFERVAVSIGRSTWVPIAQAFYALQVMDEIDALDANIFNAIHLEHERLMDEDQVTDWVVEQGLNRADFASVFSSFSVKSFLARGEQLSRAHKIPSVPTLVIDGKFMLPIVDNNTFAEQLARADMLIAKARAEKVR